MVAQDTQKGVFLISTWGNNGKGGGVASPLYTLYISSLDFGMAWRFLIVFILLYGAEECIHLDREVTHYGEESGLSLIHI